MTRTFEALAALFNILVLSLKRDVEAWRRG